MPRRRSDTVGIFLAWSSGLFLIATCAFIVLYLFIHGVAALSWSFLSSDPLPGSIDAGVQGGIRAPIFGSVIVIDIGTAIAFPVGLATAIFLAEYRRPSWLATLAEASIDVIFGVPSIVFALFGVAIFTSSNLVFLSSKVGSSGLAYGKSFWVAGIVFSLMALPPIVKASQEALFSVSNLQREASLALGTSKFRTIRRVVLPQARSGIATGTVLGIGRIAGDTAIVWLLLGGAIQMTRDDWYTPGAWSDTLRETGSTLTSYVYFTSPVGDGNAASKAYGAAFVLIVLTVVINAVVTLLGRRKELTVA